MSAPSAKRAPKTRQPAPAGNLVSDSGNIQPEEIARLAYSYWEARGGQGGSPEEDWFRAERQLRAGK